MGNLFRPDSPLMRFMMLITNLIALNVLWLIGCIPIVTAGASTVAMHTVLLSYINRKDDAVLKPFFRAFRENFRAVTPLWLMNLLVGAVMVAEIVYLSVGAQLWLKVVFGVLLLIYGAATSYLYPLLARYETTAKQALLNSFMLPVRHLLSSVCVVTLNVLPVFLLVAFPELFWKSILLWTVIGFSLIAYLDLKILLPVFQKYEPATEEK